MFNVRELATEKLQDLDANRVGADPQLRAAAEIIRRIRPDVLVLQEIDHDYREAEALHRNAERFVDAYLTRGGEAEPLDYPHLFAAPCNTGLHSGHDLNGDGEFLEQPGDRVYGEDSFGFGRYPGQYSMAVLSQLPIDEDGIRTFQRFLWRDLPGHHIPPGFYDADELEVLRLSSKSHWDVPVVLEGDRRLRLWIGHPTPPGFDGEEDRNGRRNFDEVAFWIAYLDGEERLVDDAGVEGGRIDPLPFVIVGDLNADPESDQARYDGRRAINALLERPELIDTGRVLVSSGARAAEAGRASSTAVFSGGMRIDYLLPSRDLEVADGGVFWPDAAEDPTGAALAEAASDHRLLWLDLELD